MPTTPWLDEEEQVAWRRFQRMQMQLQAALHRDLVRSTGLSLPDYAVLVELTDRPERRARATELARALAWEKSRLSHHLTRMEGRGLVAREECPSDRRGAFVVLTDAGRAAIEAAAPSHVRAVRTHFLDHLDHDQLATLRAVSDAVLGALGCPDEAPCTPGGAVPVASRPVP